VEVYRAIWNNLGRDFLQGFIMGIWPYILLYTKLDATASLETIGKLAENVCK
jgi:hypothetical protein